MLVKNDRPTLSVAGAYGQATEYCYTNSRAGGRASAQFSW